MSKIYIDDISQILRDFKAEKISLSKTVELINQSASSLPARETGEGVKVICYCGSFNKAFDAFKRAEYNSVITGHIALLPCFMGGTPIADYKEKADQLHKQKIELADEVFILNVGGYIGESTRSEIEHAMKIGKPIKYLEPI